MATTALIKVEQGRLGVLSSHEAYLVEFKETKASSAHRGDSARQLASVEEGGAEEEEEQSQLVYLWIGARAGREACDAARAQVCRDRNRVVRRPGRAGYCTIPPGQGSKQTKIESLAETKAHFSFGSSEPADQVPHSRSVRAHRCTLGSTQLHLRQTCACSFV